jgi:hypothetical protein
MGRTSAYTGAPVTWDEMMGSDMKLGSADYALDKPLKLDEMKVPVPGKEKAPKA